MVRTMRMVFAFSSTFALLCASMSLPRWAAAEEGSADAAAALEPIVVGKPTRVEVFPPKFTLAKSRHHMHLVVSGLYSEGIVQDLTRVAEFASTDEAVVRVEDGVAIPTG